MPEQSAEQVRDARIDCTDEDGTPCGWIEVDAMGTTGLLLEVFDASHIDGKTVTSAVTFLTFDQARRLAAAITIPPGATGD